MRFISQTLIGLFLTSLIIAENNNAWAMDPPKGQKRQRDTSPPPGTKKRKLDASGDSNASGDESPMIEEPKKSNSVGADHPLASRQGLGTNQGQTGVHPPQPTQPIFGFQGIKPNPGNSSPLVTAQQNKPSNPTPIPPYRSPVAAPKKFTSNPLFSADYQELPHHESKKKPQDIQIITPPISFKGYSSVVHTIKNVIFELLSDAESNIFVVFDQITYFPFIEKLNTLNKGKMNKHINVLTGDNPGGMNQISQVDKEINCISLRNTKAGEANKDHIGNCLIYDTPEIPYKQSMNRKMHNKFIIVDDKVLIGSPNISSSAFENNIESFVIATNKDLAELYREYHDYMITDAKTPREEARYPHYMSAKMETFNTNYKDNIQVCLAPVCRVGSFITEALSDAKNVHMNMFLMSGGEGFNMCTDFAQTINKYDASLILNIDYKQHTSQSFFKKCIDKLHQAIPKNRIEINDIEMKGNGSFHDKLILIEDKYGHKSVLIGSAGFSEAVDDNNNYESMVWIKDKAIYDFFLRHHFTLLGESNKIEHIKKIARPN